MCTNFQNNSSQAQTVRRSHRWLRRLSSPAPPPRVDRTRSAYCRWRRKRRCGTHPGCPSCKCRWRVSASATEADCVRVRSVRDSMQPKVRFFNFFHFLVFWRPPQSTLQPGFISPRPRVRAGRSTEHAEDSMAVDNRVFAKLELELS